MEHYENIGSQYENAWFYQNDSPYQNWMVSETVKTLDLSSKDVLVDIGGGSGNFTQKLGISCCFETKPTCVDASTQMISVGLENTSGDVTLVNEKALTFVKSRKHFDVCLLKEMVHHLPLNTLNEILETLYKTLMPNGRVLIITRPSVSSHYPFFAQAHEEWSKHQLSEKIYLDSLKGAGFQASVYLKEYHVEMETEEWFAMLRSKFWSHLSVFSDEFIANAIEEELKPLYDPHKIQFKDKLCFILGRKCH